MHTKYIKYKHITRRNKWPPNPIEEKLQVTSQPHNKISKHTVTNYIINTQANNCLDKLIDIKTVNITMKNETYQAPTHKGNH